MTTTARRLVAAAIAALVLTVAAACEPAPPAPPAQPPTPATQVHPDTNGVLVLIDSIGWQATARQTPYPAYGNMGWRMEHSTPWVKQIAAELQTVVVTVGTNDSNPTWTVEDELLWEYATMQAPDACWTFVLPWLGPTASPAHRGEINKARAWITGLGHPTVDWANYAQAPNVLHTDGIHLATPPGGDMYFDVYPEAAAARWQAVTDAVNMCAPAPVDPELDAPVGGLPKPEPGMVTVAAP